MSLIAAQLRAEARMTDTCRITLPGEPATDPDTGAETTPDGTVVYAGICKQQDGTTKPHAVDVNDTTVTTLTPEVHIPAGAAKVPTGCSVEIITSAERPASIGRRFRVLAPHLKTWQTAQRLPVEEVV